MSRGYLFSFVVIVIVVLFKDLNNYHKFVNLAQDSWPDDTSFLLPLKSMTNKNKLLNNEEKYLHKIAERLTPRALNFCNFAASICWFRYQLLLLVLQLVIKFNGFRLLIKSQSTNEIFTCLQVRLLNDIWTCAKVSLFQKIKMLWDGISDVGIANKSFSDRTEFSWKKILK